MLNIIKEKLDLSPDLRKKINWTKNYTSASITLEKDYLIRLEPSNLAYVDPHKVIINNYTFLFFNGIDTFYVNNLNEKHNLSEGVNSNDIKKSKTFTRIINDLKDRKVINKNEHRLIFKSPKLISEGAFEQALRHINQQNEEAAEEFYKMHSDSKKDDYQL